MGIFSWDSGKSVTRSVRRTIGGFVLLGGLALLTGCPSGGDPTKPGPEGGGPAKPGPEGGSPTKPGPEGGGPTRPDPKDPEGSGEFKIIAKAPLPVTLDENGSETLVTLPYENQEGIVPTSCVVDPPLPAVTVTKPCACSEGVCRVGIQPTPKLFGDGSFEFRLFGQSGQKEISSNVGKASVRVLEVTLSIFLGNNQEETVGKNLPGPIVVLVQNSEKRPVSGVKIFWSVEKTDKTDWKEKQIGKISSCTEVTDDRGLAQCTWTLGTALVFARQKDDDGNVQIYVDSQKVNVSAFYSFEEIYKKTLGGSFSASAKPGVIAQLSFWSVSFAVPTIPYDGYSGIPRNPSSYSSKPGVPMTHWSGEGVWVFARDRYGNPTTVEGEMDVTLSLGKKKPVGAALIGDSTSKMVNTSLKGADRNWTQGVAKFMNLKVNKAGEYALNASGSPDLISDTHRDPFNVSPGAPAKLVFTTRPGGGTAGVTWNKQSSPVVIIQDAYDNTVTDSEAKINLAIGTNPSTTGVLSGTTYLSAKNGEATFSELIIDKPENGYTLTASGIGLTVTSLPFNIVKQAGNPSPPAPGPGDPKISVNQLPPVIFNENGPETLLTLPYEEQESVVPTSCAVSFLSMVAVTTPCACSEGVCRVGVRPTPKAFGEGSFEFRLFGQSGQQKISSDIGKVSVNVLEVTLSISSGNKQKGMVGRDLPAPLKVLVQNSSGDPVRGVEVFWKIERLEGKNGNWTDEQVGKVSSCSEKTDSDGLAQCTWTLGTRIPIGVRRIVSASAFDKYGSIYKKKLVDFFSASVKPGPAAILAFWSHGYYDEEGDYRIYCGPTSTESFWVPMDRKYETAGVGLGRLVEDGKYELWVFAQDRYGNATTIKNDGTHVITLSLGATKPEGAVLSGVTTARMVNTRVRSEKTEWTQGQARFSVSLNKAGEYLFSATAFGSDFKVSEERDDFGAKVTVNPGVPSKLVFMTQPEGGVAGTIWAKQPVVAVQDAFDNVVTTSSKGKISLAIGTNPSEGVLLGTASLNVIKGIAAFSGLSINKAGMGYTLTASSETLPRITSSGFDITP